VEFKCGFNFRPYELSGRGWRATRGLKSMSQEQMRALHTDGERWAFLAGMAAAQEIVSVERTRRNAQQNGLRKFLCGALEDAERAIAERIVRLRGL
jgi:hypothetical protein